MKNADKDNIKIRFYRCSKLVNQKGKTNSIQESGSHETPMELDQVHRQSKHLLLCMYHLPCN